MAVLLLQPQLLSSKLWFLNPYVSMYLLVRNQNEHPHPGVLNLYMALIVFNDCTWFLDEMIQHDLCKCVQCLWVSYLKVEVWGQHCVVMSSVGVTLAGLENTITESAQFCRWVSKDGLGTVGRLFIGMLFSSCFSLPVWQLFESGFVHFAWTWVSKSNSASRSEWVFVLVQFLQLGTLCGDL